jgi:hypothetical protein
MSAVDKHRIDAHLKRALPRSAYHSMRSVYYGARTLARRNPGRGRVLPDFLIIGSTRCGSTSLHGWVTAHPLVATTPKEIHFFNMNYYRGTDWYRGHFPSVQERDESVSRHGRPFLVGEATASYLAHYWTPRRLRKLLPDARLIVSLRDPVERAHSQYHYFRRRGPVEVEPLPTFEEAITAEEGRLRGEVEREIADPHYHSWRVYRWGYLRTSRYAEHLERWFEVFPREQFLFLNFHELIRDPRTALEQVCEHLGLPQSENAELPALNGGLYLPVAPATRARLDEHFAPHNERLRELTGIDFSAPTPAAA